MRIWRSQNHFYYILLQEIYLTGKISGHKRGDVCAIRFQIDEPINVSRNVGPQGLAPRNVGPQVLAPRNVGPQGLAPGH